MKTSVVLLVMMFPILTIAGTTYTDYGDWTYYEISPEPDPFTDESDEKTFRAEVSASYPGVGELIVSCSENGVTDITIKTYGDLFTGQEHVIFRIDKGDVWKAIGFVPHSIYSPLDTAFPDFKIAPEEHEEVIQMLKSGNSVVFRLESRQYSGGSRIQMDNKYSLKGSSAALQRVISECGADFGKQ